MRPDLIAAYFKSLTTARASGVPVAPPEGIPTYQEALAIQSQVQETLGEVAGFKLGPGPNGNPVLGPIPVARVFDSGAPIPSPDMAGVELEIAFELMRPLGDGPLHSVFRPRLVMELVDCRLVGDDLEPTQKLADMQSNDGLVLGPVLDGWDGADFGSVQAAMNGAGRVLLDGAAEVPGGSALGNLQLFLDKIGDHCGGLKVGHHVITGSLCGLPWFEAGSTVQATVAGFGEITAQLVPQTR
ncbi:2-keto-4-pentenoate hydratase [Primorskyibacter sedentarius]|uniref:2-keto-4-pentenoate hydratase n=1 Tax=Primorskyibacter sedentarius TaxID=745311 RepID=A0A4R3J3G2_9RHOB|nr:hydratase [Primorskyibacter sedentarius]TCS59715.1 2-keto-4-pentenoate hydratase [Primorskyibacter sedentarius]